MLSVLYRPSPGPSVCLSVTWPNILYTDYTDMISVGIDLKELGGQLPKCLKFRPGIEVYGWFSLKNEPCSVEMNWGVQPPTIPTLHLSRMDQSKMVEVRISQFSPYRHAVCVNISKLKKRYVHIGTRKWHALSIHTPRSITLDDLELYISSNFRRIWWDFAHFGMQQLLNEWRHNRIVSDKIAAH